MVLVLLSPENKVTKALSRTLRENGQDFVEMSLDDCGALSTLYFGKAEFEPLKRPSRVWFSDSRLGTCIPHWFALSAFTDSVEWVNSPHALRKSNALINQLHIADICGFTLPNCIVTTDIEKLKQFYEKNEAQVTLLCQAGRTMDFKELARKTAELPEAMIMRQHIPKHDIIRVYVFKDHIQALKLDGNQFDCGENDVEQSNFSSLAEDHLRSIKRYSRLMRLEFFTIDFARTKNGELLFLNGYASDHIVNDEKSSPEIGLMNSLCTLVTTL